MIKPLQPFHFLLGKELQKMPCRLLGSPCKTKQANTKVCPYVIPSTTSMHTFDQPKQESWKAGKLCEGVKATMSRLARGADSGLGQKASRRPNSRTVPVVQSPPCLFPFCRLMALVTGTTGTTLSWCPNFARWNFRASIDSRNEPCFQVRCSSQGSTFTRTCRPQCPRLQS